MCGIAGIIATGHERVETALRAMVRAQAHRGPDDEGTEVVEIGDLAMGLGATRLAIVDLSPAGHQPMTHPGTGDRLLFSGELYDYRTWRQDLEKRGVRFKGRSDTEVVLHAIVEWGIEVIARFNGMFAIAFVDCKQRKLTLARDALGIRPLYVAQEDDGILFANEVRALLASKFFDPVADISGLTGFLAFGASQSPNTLFKQIRMFPRGTMQTFALNGATVRPEPSKRFWRFPSERRDVSPEDLCDELSEALLRAVRSEIVADVPIGVFLSSGLDSAIVAGLAADQGCDLGALTVGFPDHSDLSETAAAANTARHFGVPHFAVEISDREALQHVERWLDALDHPSIDGLNMFIAARAARAAGFKLALSGQGGDEIFGGHPSFVDVPRISASLHYMTWLPSTVRARFARTAAAGLSFARREKAADIAASTADLLELYCRRRQLLPDADIAALGFAAARCGYPVHCPPPSALDGLPDDVGDPIRAVARFETHLYLGNMLLRDSDVNCMANGLEVRVPLLNRSVIDLALSVPGSLLVQDGKADKILLRKAAQRVLRLPNLRSRKLGFCLPYAAWMRGPLRDLCEDALEAVVASNLLRPIGVRGIWRRFLADSDGGTWSRAWALCVLGRYLRSHPIRPGAEQWSSDGWSARSGMDEKDSYVESRDA